MFVHGNQRASKSSYLLTYPPGIASFEREVDRLRRPGRSNIGARSRFGVSFASPSVEPANEDGTDLILIGTVRKKSWTNIMIG
jgi:hypothetical protein